MTRTSTKAADPVNSYGLPPGTAIKGMLLRWFRRQLKAILGTLKTIGVDLPAIFPSLADYNDPMAAAMTPILSAWWDSAGKKVRERLGLDPAEWRVTDPHLAAKIQTAAFDFCAATNATTSKQLNAALADLRSELAAGLVDAGDTLPQLTKRVNAIFDKAEKWRAQRIAATEASRAVHAAEYQSAAESGVVAGFQWLASADACPLCQKVATEAKYVKLDQPFATGMGANPAYSTVKHPPLHPGCQCSMLEVLTPEYGGPSDVPWSTATPPPPAPTTPPPHEHTPPTVLVGPGPAPVKPTKPKPSPKPKPTAQPKPKAPEFPADADQAVELVRRLGGSTGAELVRDKATGALFVRKAGASPNHLRSEAAADAMYAALGMDVPASKIYESKKGPVKLAAFVEGKTLGELKASDPAAYKKAVAKLREGFAADALLGNWDVVGANLDNVVVGGDGKVWRIDNGGALKYRAQGGLKSSEKWGGLVGEIWSMRDPASNPSAAGIFGELKEPAIKAQVRRLEAARAGLLKATPTDLARTMSDRLDHIKNWSKATRPRGDWQPTPASEFVSFHGDTARMEKFGEQQYASWAKSLTKAEVEALSYYTGSGYRVLNGAIREGRQLPPIEAGYVAALDSALRKGATPIGLVANRRFPLSAIKLVRDQIKPGDQLPDLAFTSTTLRNDVSFTGEHFEVRIPRGFPGAYVNASAAGSSVPSEREFLLPRNICGLRVVEVKPDKIITEAVLCKPSKPRKAKP